MHVLERTLRLPITREEAWSFFSNAANLARVTPPEMGFEVVSNLPERMYAGMIIIYRVRPFARIPLNWVTEITQVDEPHRFVDEQRFGPYRFWHHQHHFREVPGGVEIRDLVHYALPPGVGLIRGPLIAPRLDAVFDYRQRVLEERFGG
jgi:ligand-binding SRPBCC domain-containing protein